MAFAAGNRAKNEWVEKYFLYPDEMNEAAVWASKYQLTHEVYIAPHLFDRSKRLKEYVSITPCAWADLDGADPKDLQPAPSIVVQSSPGHYHAYWLFTGEVPPKVAQDISKRIARTYRELGVDQTGWDLTQLLRLPETLNHKRSTVEQVFIVPEMSPGTTYSFPDFADLQDSEGELTIGQLAMLPDGVANLTMEMVIERYRGHISPLTFKLIYEVPENGEDWSRALWNLECNLLEAGLSMEEAFVVCRQANCNKFKRDQKPDSYLWKDISRAWVLLSASAETGETAKVGLLSESERMVVANAPKDVVDHYVEWACSKGDAPPAYHNAGALTILSSLLCGDLYLATSFGTIIPNLWFMLLADTTLTRKTTAMNMAIDVMDTIDPGIILATDGTPEALLSELASRPGIPSLFWRDEVSGLLDAMKRDYMSGMLEQLTQLYDGRMIKRLLRSGTIEVRDPRLLILSGGIRSRIMEILTPRHVDSGFLPRFLFVMGTSSIEEMKPLGPPTEESDNRRMYIVNEFKELYDRYKFKSNIEISGQQLAIGIRVNAAPDVWDRYNELEKSLLYKSMNSAEPTLHMPMMDRLCKSLLRVAILLAAVRCTGDVVIEMVDLLRAISMAEIWQAHATAVLLELGKSTAEKQIERALTYIKTNAGCAKAALMRSMHLTAKDSDWIISTLIQRGLIRAEAYGKERLRLFPIKLHGR